MGREEASQSRSPSRPPEEMRPPEASSTGKCEGGCDFPLAPKHLISEIPSFKFDLSVSWEGEDLKPACGNQLRVSVKYPH